MRSKSSLMFDVLRYSKHKNKLKNKLQKKSDSVKELEASPIEDGNEEEETSNDC
jgi:hypothetical protein